MIGLAMIWLTYSYLYNWCLALVPNLHHLCKVYAQLPILLKCLYITNCLQCSVKSHHACFISVANQRHHSELVLSTSRKKNISQGIGYNIWQLWCLHLSTSSPFLCYTSLSFSAFKTDLPWHPWICRIHLDKSAHFITPISDVTISIHLGVVGCYLSKLMITSNASCSIQRNHCIQSNETTT
jgi:hypothetical protein